MTTCAKSTPANCELLPRPPGLKTLISMQLVFDDVEADQEHAVAHQLGPHDFDHAEHLVGDFDRLAFAAGVHVAAGVAAFC